MKHKIPPGLQLVVVIWRDAYGPTGEQSSKEELLKQTRSCIRYSPGWYIGETDTDLVICMDFDLRENQPTYGGPTQFPKETVISVVKVATTPKRRVRPSRASA